MSFNIASVLSSVAPTLATMVGGPLAGTAVLAITKALGLNSDNGGSLAAITEVVQNGNLTPENLVALRAADQEHAEKLAQQGIDLQKLNMGHIEALAATAASDRASARTREISVKDNTPRVLTYIYTVGLFAVIGVEFGLGVNHLEIDPLIHSTLDTLLGVLVTICIGAKEYYLGTSSGDARKTELLASKPNGD